MTGLRRTLRDRRGFTLVELVVVLVILGIAASFAVPALTGYIDTSKEKKAVSEAQARQRMTAWTAGHLWTGSRHPKSPAVTWP